MAFVSTVAVLLKSELSRRARKERWDVGPSAESERVSGIVQTKPQWTDKPALQALWLIVCLGFLLVLMPRVALGASELVRFGSTPDQVDLSASLWMLEDPEGRLSLADVLKPENQARFVSVRRQTHYQPSAFWFRFRIEVPESAAGRWWFDSGNRWMQEVDLFAPDLRGEYRQQSTGSDHAFGTRPLPTADFVFPIDLPAGQVVDIYLRARSTAYNSVSVAPRLWRPAAYQAHANREKAQWLIYLGLAGGLGLFNLVLFFSLRDTIYLSYVLSLLSIVWAVSSGRGGYGSAYEYFWPDSPVFEQVGWIASPAAVLLFVFPFIFRFIGLRQSMPRMHDAFRMCIALTLTLAGWIIVVTTFQWPHSVWLLQRFQIAFSLLVLVLLLGLAFVLFRLASRGSRPALLFSMAWLPLLVNSIYQFGAISAGNPGNPALSMWASAFELVFMSLSLADRLHQERRAKFQAQAELVTALQKSERELEGKVAERTAEVNAQAAVIAAWNSTLEQRVQEQVAQIDRLGRLKRFFSPQLADAIVAGGEEALKSHRREVTVVFIDLRGFTAFTDRAEPEEVIETLREFYSAMGQIVLEYGGTLERFAGDSMMVFFNDPVPMEGHAEQAVRMALAMQRRFRELAASWQRRGFTLGLGSGVARGYATLGEIGFEGRWDYAAIGGVTNLAARLCAEAAPAQVLVDRKVMGAIEGKVRGKLVGPLALRGFAEPVPAFAVTEIETD